MYSNKFLQVLLAFGAVGLLSNCADNDTPRGASTVRLLVNPKSVEQHLTERRRVLNGLQSDSNGLDTRVSIALRELRRAQERQEGASQTNAASATNRHEIEGEVTERREQGEHLRFRIQTTQARIRELENEKAEAQSDLQTNQGYVDQLDSQIKQLALQVQQFEDLNARTVRRASENALREPQ